MSKTARPAAAKSTDTSYQKTVAAIVIALLLLIAASLLSNQTYLSKDGATSHPFAMGSNNKDELVSEAKPKFADLGTFAAQMGRDDGEPNMQISISLKLTQPGLEEKIKARIPEIKHHVNMVLQSKRTSELATYEGKEKLAQQIKEHIEYVIGFRKTAPSIGSAQAETTPIAKKSGISSVLFTSFVIQY